MTNQNTPAVTGQAAALPKHSSAAFASMGAEFTQAHLDGLIPMSQQQIDSVIASDWFKSLRQGQKAAYVVRWFHFAAVGSNQHKHRISTTSTRFASEAAQSLIQRAANV